MGGGRFDSTSYRSYTSTVKHKSRKEIFKSTNVDTYLDPKKIQIRESCDSPDKGPSTPIIVGLDVTGSMGFIPEAMIKGGLGKLFENLLEHEPITDPHVMFMGIGDCTQLDRSPLQCTQFEANNVIVEQLEKIWLEGGGGGNSFESYDLPWQFALHKVRSDAWDKRKKKGYIFTIGDEEFPRGTDTTYIKEACGATQAAKPEDYLEAIKERYDVFHIVALEGSHARYHKENVLGSWRTYLGKRVLPLSDHNMVSELICCAISINEGHDPEEVVQSYANCENVLREALGI